MANIRDINRKISSLRNMQKVMSAMNMIASTKFSKLLTKQASLVKFEKNLSSIKKSLFNIMSQSNSPFLNSGKMTKKSHIIIFTADRGLCGSHNSSVLKSLISLVKDIDDFDVTAIGLKGANFCRKKEFSLYHSIDINSKTLTDNDILRINETVINRYKKGEIGSLYIIFNKFVSSLSQPTVTEKILPMDMMTETDNKRTSITTDIYADELVLSAVPLLVLYKLKVALLNSYISENGARMTAMENASNNSQDLIERYGSIKNRARQTTITNELTEIVSGKEAMNN